MKITHPAAFDTCQCGHNRIAHLSHGRGACSRTSWHTYARQNGGTTTVNTPCGCARFTPRGQIHGTTDAL